MPAIFHEANPGLTLSLLTIRNDGGDAKEMLERVATLVASGRIHGPLPNPNELGRYHPEDLRRLLEGLRQSVEQRIQNTANMGATVGHDARLAEEQQLIQAIERYLGGR